MKHPATRRDHGRAVVSPSVMQGSIRPYVMPTIDGATGHWPRETDTETLAWKHAGLGQIARMIELAAAKPAQVSVQIGMDTPTGPVPWRTWDPDTKQWVTDLPEPFWPIAQIAYDRHIAADLPDMITVGLECLQVAGRFALVSYPAGVFETVRRWPVDELGREIVHPRLENMKPDDKIKFRETVEYSTWWTKTAKDAGAWKTRVCRIASVTKRNDRWQIAVAGGATETLPRHSTVVYVSRDGAAGAAPKAGWVQAAANEIAVFQAALAAQHSQAASQILADVWLVPAQASPIPNNQIPQDLFGPGLLSTGQESYSEADVLGALLARIAQHAVKVAAEGGQVFPAVLDMDGDLIAKVRDLALGRTLDPGVAAATDNALKLVALASAASTDEFFGFGSGSGFNRNIGDTVTDQEIANAVTRAGWLVEQFMRALVYPYVADQNIPASDVARIEALIDGNDMRPPPKLSARDVATLVQQGVISPDVGAKTLGLEPPETGETPETPDVPIPASIIPVRAAKPVADPIEILTTEIVAVQTGLVETTEALLTQALANAADRLGAVLRSKEKDPARKALIASVVDRHVAETLGPDRVATIVAGLGTDDEEQQSRLFDKAVEALLLVWALRAKAAWKRITKAFVAAGIVEDPDEIVDEERIAELVAAASLVLSTGARRLFRTLLDPVVYDTDPNLTARIEAGETVGVATTGVAVRTTTALGGADVDDSTSDPGVSAGVFVPGGIIVEHVATKARLVGWQWNYGPAERAAPAPWHVDNATRGTVATLDKFDGHVGDHKGCKCLPVTPVWETK